MKVTQQMNNNPRRTILVTGASRGIGKAVCLELARQNHHIIALARTFGGLEELADEIDTIGSGSVTLMPQDLNDGNALEGLGPALFEKFGQLDGLVANAGMLGALTPVAQTDPKQWETIFRVNVTANLHLIRTLDPLLRQAPQGRAVFVTSNAATSPRAYWGAYAASKSALDNMVNTYAQEVANTNLKVSLYNPGRVATQMRAQAYPGENQETLSTPEDIAPELVKLVL